MNLARVSLNPLVGGALLVTATFLYSIVPVLNFYAHGWEYPLMLTGLMRMSFSCGVIAILAVKYRPLLSGQGLRAAQRIVREDWRLFGLTMLSTLDVALFSLSYRFVDISITTTMTALVPAASVLTLSFLNKDWLTRRQIAGLAVSVAGVMVVMWAGGTTIEGGGQSWRVVLGMALSLGVVLCGGLASAALRLGEAIGLEWYWDGLGTGAGLVWCGSMLTLALAQGMTAPLFVLIALPTGIPSLGSLGLMTLMGLVVLLGTTLWALANGSGLRPVINSIGDFQPAWALLILLALGIAGRVDWIILATGLALIIGSNMGMQLWGGRG